MDNTAAAADNDSGPTDSNTMPCLTPKIAGAPPGSITSEKHGLFETKNVFDLTIRTTSEPKLKTLNTEAEWVIMEQVLIQLNDAIEARKVDTMGNLAAEFCSNTEHGEAPALEELKIMLDNKFEQCRWLAVAKLMFEATGDPYCPECLRQKYIGGESPNESI